MHTFDHPRLFMLPLLIVLSCTPMWAQNGFWEYCFEPAGGYIFDFTTAPDGTVYTASSPIYRSTDEGLTWTALQPNVAANAIITTPDGTLYRTAGRDLLTSSSDGTHWNLIPEVSFEGFPDVYGDEGALSFVISKSAVIYAISRSDVYRTSQGEWRRMRREIPYPYSLGADSLGGVLVGTGNGLFITDESADSGWTQIRRSGVVYSVAYSPAGYWFCSDNKGIYRTHTLDSLHTAWDTVYHSPLSYSRIHSISTTTSGEMYAIVGSAYSFSESEGLLQSVDSGATWQIYPTPPLTAITFTGNNKLLGGMWGAGVIRSSDNGQSWMLSNTGMAGINIHDIAVTPAGTIYIAAEGRGLLRSTDRGDSWESAFSDREYSGFSSILVSSKGSLLTTTSVIERSSDKGASWQTVFNNNYAGISGLLETRPGEIYGWSGSKPMVKSTDDGITWMVLENSPRSYEQRPVRDSVGVLWLPQGNLWRSTDDGNLWETLESPAPASNCVSMIVQPSGALILTTDVGVMRSADNGQSWSIISSEHPSGHLASVIASIGDDNIFIADSNRSVYLSTDNGTTWKPTPLPAQVNAIAADSSGYVYAATRQGVYRSRARQILSSAPIAQKAQEKLEIDYRDGILTLHADISYAGPATLTVTTLDGRQISTYDTDLQGQTYAAKFPLPNLATGVYLCQIYSNNQLFSSRFVVLR